MPQLLPPRPREITAAAIVAFVGGSFFAFAGTVACMVFAISRKYRGSNHNARPDVRDVMAFFAYLAAVPLLLIKG